nr:hypothetical protein [uncultured Flavobacterium sp.]
MTPLKTKALKETFRHLEKLDNTIVRSDFENIFLAANIIKDASFQIDEIVHALVIMIAKEVLLNENKEEQLEYLSLGAGNHKERFDMENNLRIAEFKFGKWNEKNANGIRRRAYSVIM